LTLDSIYYTIKYITLLEKLMTKTRVTKDSIRETAKHDHAPKWDGVEKWDVEKFNQHFHDSMTYYRVDYTKDLKPKVIDWMGRNGYDRATINQFKNTKDWRTSAATGSIAANLLKGMPEAHPGWNNGTNAAAWLREQIAQIIADGKADNESQETAAAVSAPVVSIQDRIRDQAVSMCDDIDGAIDNFITDPDAFEVKKYNVANLLRGKGAKGPQARYVKGFYESNYNDLKLVAAGEADAALKEGYKHFAKKNLRKIVDFYEHVMSACDQIIAEAKVLKKPRKKKSRSAEEQVKKIKFKLSDDKLGITSVPSTQIIGAQGVVVYNTKNRKIGYYTANSGAGLLVKGTSIAEFNTASVQKTLRKPPEQIKEFKEQNTQKRFEAWFGKNIKTTETALNGRLNQDIIILKVFK